jgi:hypothetical protein
MFGIKDEYGRIRYERSGTLERIFGIRQRDLGVLNGHETWQTEDLTCNAWIMRMEGEAAGAAVLGRFSDGAPALLRSSCGKGTALRIQTAFFQRYGLYHEWESLRCLKALLEGTYALPACRLDTPSDVLTAKLLSDGDNHVFMLFNASDKLQKAVVTIPAEAEVRWLTEAPGTGMYDGKMTVMLQPGATAVAHIRA